MNLEQLEKLNELKEKGIITEEEYEKQKEKILNSQDTATKTEVTGKDNIVINNTVNVDNKTPRKIGLFTILGFIVGIGLMIGGIGAFGSLGVGTGIFMILSGIVIFPPFNDFLEKKFKIKLSRVLRIIIFIILMVISASLSKDSKSNSGSTISTPGTASQTANEEIIYNIGDVITTKDFEITIISVEEKTKVGTTYFNSKPAEGAEYIAVQYKYKNISQEPISSWNFPTINLVDEKGTKYSYDISATSYYSTEIDPDRKVLSDLNPKISTTDCKVFEISKELYQTGSWTLFIDADKDSNLKIK